MGVGILPLIKNISRKGEKMNKGNYELRITDEYIIVTMKNGAGADYFTYNDDFVQVLKEWHFSLFRNNGRLQCDCWKDKYCDAIRFYLYDLAYACYTGMLRADSLIADLQHYYDWKTSRGLTIDHADNNVHNNTVLNLSPMLRGTNAAKSGIAARFLPPYYLNSIFYNGEYRVQVAYDIANEYIANMLSGIGLNGICISGNGRAAMYFRCDDAESYVACLQGLWNSRYDWCNPESTPREYAKENNLVEYWAGNIGHSLQAQKVLSMMEQGTFQQYVK